MANLGLDLSKTAVLAMDFQKGIITYNAMAQERNVIQKVKAVLNGARQARLPVIHVVIQFREGYPEVSSRNRMFSGVMQMGLFLTKHEDTMIEESLGPLEGDIVISRPRVNAFYGSDLQTVLTSKGIDTIILMGLATNWVVEGTARYAADADYRVIVLEDCCAGISVEAHNFSIANVFNTIAEVSTSEEFLASLK
ncbi:cysteine hydrolase [Chloroflexota bacterium]